MGRFAAASLGVLAFALSGLMVAPALAQDKMKAEKGAPKATMKVLKETAKVRVYEVTFVPGAENSAIPTSSVRVVRALAGGTLQRTYADGKKENIVYKTGEVRINEVSPAFTTRNIGKSEVRLYVVQLK